jgi:hypothetical protein
VVVGVVDAANEEVATVAEEESIADVVTVNSEAVAVVVATENIVDVAAEEVEADVAVAAVSHSLLLSTTNLRSHRWAHRSPLLLESGSAPSTSLSSLSFSGTTPRSIVSKSRPQHQNVHPAQIPPGDRTSNVTAHHVIKKNCRRNPNLCLGNELSVLYRSASQLDG